MGVIDTHLETLEVIRGRTLALLDTIEKEPDAQKILAWRPGPGRAHIGWQLMHIGVTEEIFATARLAIDPQRRWEDLWPRFRGGSTPDDDVPTPAQIRRVLSTTREKIASTLLAIGDAGLEMVPDSLQERGWRVRDVLSIVAWHEAHHHGQAHLTLNLYRAQHA